MRCDDEAPCFETLLQLPGLAVVVSSQATVYINDLLIFSALGQYFRATALASMAVSVCPNVQELHLEHDRYEAQDSHMFTSWLMTRGMSFRGLLSIRLRYQRRVRI
jgi:hypothetical protein